jgi:hypothetical protein
MKLSANTLNILKNFAGINESIYVKPGNVIETISKQKNILAKAELTDTFDAEFGIHDLNNFLGNLTLSRDSQPEIEIEEKNIIIKGGPGGISNTEYRKATKETILVPPDKTISMENAEIKFSLDAQYLEWISRVASALGSPNIAFVSDGENVKVETFDAKDDSSHVNSTKLSVSGNGKTYRMVFSTENLRFIPGAYEITIASKGIGHFKNTTLAVEYWVTTETGSKYEG